MDIEVKARITKSKTSCSIKVVDLRDLTSSRTNVLIRIVKNPRVYSILYIWLVITFLIS